MMPNIDTEWRTVRPAEGFYSATLPAGAAGQPVRTFLPERYEPRYAYPLVVIFHGNGADEESALRLAPRLSRRNFVAIALRGPHALGLTRAGRPAYSWGENGGDTESVTDAVLRAVEHTRRTYHVHSERVFLMGLREGATAAYRAAFALGDRVAGVLSLNGVMPRPLDQNPVFRLDRVRRQNVLIAHAAPAATSLLPNLTRDHGVLYAAGANVHLRHYLAATATPAEWLRDANRWLIEHVTAADSLFPAAR